MWTDGTRMVAEHDAYTAPDGTQYPANFPKDQIPGLVAVAPPPPPPPPTPEELAAQEAANAAAAAKAFQESIVQKTQERLDAFARTRNYDGILSACTYATSAIPKFRSEGQYCVDARDASWATLYQLMADVQAGVRQIPSTTDEVLSLLPALTWPA